MNPPESEGLPDVVLPEDAVPWLSVRCPRCGATGECLGDYGYVRPHRERLAVAS